MALLDLGEKIIAKPNNSLSLAAGLKLFGALVFVLVVVSLGFAGIGAWLVLPFAGLEVFLFASAFYYVYLHSTDFDSITINGDVVVVEKKNNKEFTTSVFQRYWAQISLRDVAGGGVARKALFIRSHGEEVEFGKGFISDEQRSALARNLREKLKLFVN